MSTLSVQQLIQAFRLYLSITYNLSHTNTASMSGTAVNQHFRVPCIVVVLPLDIQYLKPTTACPHDIFNLVVIIIGVVDCFHHHQHDRDQHHHLLSLHKIPTSDEDPPLMTVVLVRVRSSQPVICLPHSRQNMLSNHNPRSLILIDCHYFSTLIRPH